MSENKEQSPSNAVEDSTNHHLESADPVEGDAQTDDWQDVPLPGTVTYHSETDQITPDREKELLRLIHDLNECNDVLLAKVSQQEAALRKAQQTIQTQSSQMKLAHTQMTEQLSAQQAAAQLVSQNAQQQVAQLVAQLETAETGLQRQQLVNENLHSELTNAQERVTQLERECALSAQQYATEAQARLQAESSNKDLRSRLQRQQRYTMQFKAALEKSLTVTARAPRQATHGIADTVPTHTSGRYYGARTDAAVSSAFDASNVNMPKARRIMPWASASASNSFEGIDPHLESLIRGANQAAAESTRYSEPPITDAPLPLQSEKVPTQGIPTEKEAVDVAAVDTGESVASESAAADQLWQDIERVMEEPEATTAAEVDVVDAVEPKLNWQTQQITASSEKGLTEGPLTEKKSTQSNEIPPLAVPSTPAVSALPISSRLNKPLTQSELDFTEPSPWGMQPLPSIADSDSKSPSSESPNPSLESARGNSYVPAIDGEESSISPVVNRLRPQKKTGKLSSIQLPTFEKAKAGSFKS